MNKKWKCPSCKKIVKGYPALSRRDNKTKICSFCGTLEAFNDFFGFRNQPIKKTLDDKLPIKK